MQFQWVLLVKGFAARTWCDADGTNGKLCFRGALTASVCWIFLQDDCAILRLRTPLYEARDSVLGMKGESWDTVPFMRCAGEFTRRQGKSWICWSASIGFLYLLVRVFAATSHFIRFWVIEVLHLQKRMDPMYFSPQMDGLYSTPGALSNSSLRWRSLHQPRLFYNFNINN
jgi:hypothetical protein